MMVGNDDPWLSLSLGSSMENHHHYHHESFHSMQQQQQHQLSLMPPEHHQFLSPSKWTNNLQFASSSDAETRRSLPEDATAAARPILRGIDMNRTPPATETEMNKEEEEAGTTSSPHSTSLSSFSGKRSERDHAAEELSSRGISDEDDGEGSRKKMRLSKDQSAVLEESFKEHSILNPNQKLVLAKQLNLRPRQVEVWFQNRRARKKLKQTEMDCEYMNRCCENLTEENRRLKKEAAELRALKLSPQFYMQMTPPTTLTICPSCGGGAAAENHYPQHRPAPAVAASGWVPSWMN